MPSMLWSLRLASLRSPSVMERVLVRSTRLMELTLGAVFLSHTPSCEGF